MFQIDDMVVHKTGGVFVVKEITDMNFGTGVRKYFILNPYFSKIAKTNTKIYVPKDTAPTLMRYILNENDVYALIDAIPSY